MSACTFFGHRDCPGWVRPQLRAALESLMESCRVLEFYLGNHGAFDAMALSLLRELEGRYPDLRYTVVLAYMPGEGEGGTLGAETIFPQRPSPGTCRAERISMSILCRMRKDCSASFS